MGSDHSKRQAEIAALCLGLDLGMTLIDTAEIYAEGGSEEVVAEAISGRRSEAFVVTKVSPQHATKQGTIKACDQSLQRLKTDYIDIYLLHWPASVPFAETLEAFRHLKQSGKIRDYGVSNFDEKQMEQAASLPGGGEIATNQVPYSLASREIERNLLPWCQKHSIPVMAYSPFEQGRVGLLSHPQLKAVAARHNATTAQIALAWLLKQDWVMVIPKAASEAHVRENHTALDITLTDEDLTELDQAFPP
jgi:diketogulonate reductase-like aldo/keto reductase